MTGIHDYQSDRKRLEEMRGTLQQKLSRLQGELVVAVSRDYEEFRMNPHGPVDSYSIQELLEIGLIGNETSFGRLDSPELSPLIEGLQSTIYQSKDGKFLTRDVNRFWGIDLKGIFLLVDMHEPPELPIQDNSIFGLGEGNLRQGFPRPGPMINKTRDSRLELYIGNSMAGPYLKGRLGEEVLSEVTKKLRPNERFT
jgi:hypothetical protein